MTKPVLKIDSVTMVLTVGDQTIWSTFSPRDAADNRLSVFEFTAKLKQIAESLSAAMTAETGRETRNHEPMKGNQT
jgi:hypothetical protein